MPLTTGQIEIINKVLSWKTPADVYFEIHVTPYTSDVTLRLSCGTEKFHLCITRWDGLKSTEFLDDVAVALRQVARDKYEESKRSTKKKPVLDTSRMNHG